MRAEAGLGKCTNRLNVRVDLRKLVQDVLTFRLVYRCGIRAHKPHRAQMHVETRDRRNFFLDHRHAEIAKTLYDGIKQRIPKGAGQDEQTVRIIQQLPESRPRKSRPIRRPL